MHRKQRNGRGTVTIVPVTDPEQLIMVRTLFEMYAASLDFDLNFQDFQAELASLPGKYASPGGVILLALADGAAAGCVALRPQSDGICEMKRLFVRDHYRGLGIGKSLVQRVLEEAKKWNYSAVRLDTLPSMQEAIRMYESLGFRDIPSYRYNPFSDARYLELNL